MSAYLSPNAITAIRKKCSLTQARAASLIGVAQNTWARWEQGIFKPNTVDEDLIGAVPSIVKHGYPPPCRKYPKQWDKIVPHSRGCHKCRRLLFWLARMSEEKP